MEKSEQLNIKTQATGDTMPTTLSPSTLMMTSPT
jgi:hypothetical protein